MKTFEQVWADTGRQYGSEELEGVKLGWDMAQVELATLKREHAQLRAAAEFEAIELLAHIQHAEVRYRNAHAIMTNAEFDGLVDRYQRLRAALDATTAEPVREQRWEDRQDDQDNDLDSLKQKFEAHIRQAAEPVRETFDTEAVRAIQAALQFSDRLPERIVRQLGDVMRTSERK